MHNIQTFLCIADEQLNQAAGPDRDHDVNALEGDPRTARVWIMDHPALEIDHCMIDPAGARAEREIKTFRADDPAGLKIYVSVLF